MTLIPAIVLTVIAAVNSYSAYVGFRLTHGYREFGIRWPWVVMAWTCMSVSIAIWVGANAVVAWERL